MAEETDPNPPPPPRKRSPQPPTVAKLLTEARRLAADAPADAERIAKAVSAILRAQSDHADWLERSPTRKRLAARKETDFDERRAEVARRHDADIARARAEGYAAGRRAAADGAGIVAADGAAGSEPAGA